MTLLSAIPATGAGRNEVLAKGPFLVEYPIGARILAEAAADAAQSTAKELEHLLPIGNGPVYIVICDDVYEFTRYAGRYTPDSVGGVAYGDAGLIAVKRPEALARPSDFEGVVRHELVHVLLARNVPEGHMPRWLNEGLAMMLSRERRFESSYRVGRMYYEGRLADYAHLDGAFLAPGQEREFGDAYAQALVLTRFVRSHLGEETFWRMVQTLKDRPFPEALEEHGGITDAGLYEAWRRSLWKVALVFALVSGFSLFQVMAALTVAAYLRKRRRGRRILAEWDAEESDRSPKVLSVHDLEGGEPYPWEEEDEYP